MTDTDAAHAKLDGRRDFDFLHGRWSVDNRKLRDPFDDESEWLEFPASVETKPILHGLGNVDFYSAVRFPTALGSKRSRCVCSTSTTTSGVSGGRQRVAAASLTRHSSAASTRRLACSSATTSSPAASSKCASTGLKVLS
jgi:hypothetical protein